MSVFQKLAKAFTDDRNTRASSNTGDDRDQVIRGTKKTSRLINDDDWIRNKPSSDESQNMSADVNYGRSALSRVKSEEGLNSDPNSKLRPPTKSDTIDGRRSGTADPSKTQRSSTLDRPARGSGSTNATSPASKHSSLDRNTSSTDPTSKSGLGETSPKRFSPYKTDDSTKMTIITSETKNGSPTNKGLLSRPSPDGQVTTQEKSPAKPILKWGSQKDEPSESSYTPKTSILERYTAKTPTKTEAETLIDLTPTTENKSKGTLDFTSKVGSKSLIDLSITPANPTKKSPAFTPTTPARTSSLIDLTPSTPDKPKRNSGEWDSTSGMISTKTTYNPNSRSSRNSGDWDNAISYTKSTFDPRSSGEWDNTKISTKTSPDNILKSTRSPSEHALPKDEPSTYKSPTSYSRSSRNSSPGSFSNKSPVTEEHLYNSRSAHKENSPPSEQHSDSDEPSVYQSPSYPLQKIRNSSSSLSDGKGPSKVITITKGFSSAEQKAMDKNVCSQCYKPITKGAKMILEDMNINCHAACFKCQLCNSSLENLNAGDNFWVHRRTVHCEPCYDKVKAQWKF